MMTHEIPGMKEAYTAGPPPLVTPWPGHHRGRGLAFGGPGLTHQLGGADSSIF